MAVVMYENEEKVYKTLHMNACRISRSASCYWLVFGIKYEVCLLIRVLKMLYLGREGRLVKSCSNEE